MGIVVRDRVSRRDNDRQGVESDGRQIPARTKKEDENVVGKIVAVSDGKRVQMSRIEKMLQKNQGVFRPELAKKSKRK